MTRRETTTYDKVRALFLATLMVVSVFGGTVAFAGSAAATQVSLDADYYTGGEQATITVGAGSVNANNEKIEQLNVEVKSASTEDVETVTLEETGKDTGMFEGTIQTEVTDSKVDENGWIEAPSGAEITVTYEGAIATATFDAKAPAFGDASPTGEINTPTPLLDVPLTDENTSINESTIEIDIDKNSGENYVHEVNVPSSTSDGIEYDGSNVTVDMSASKLKALEDGTYTVEVTAEDVAGNPATTDFEITVDTESAFDFTLSSPTDQDEDDSDDELEVGTDNPTIQVDISGSDTVAEANLTAYDANGNILFQNNTSDGVYTPPSFTVTPKTDVNALSDSGLPNGVITLEVNATDTAGNLAEQTFQLKVDTQQPHVDSITTDKLLYTEDESTAEIAVNFNESVDADEVAVKIDAGSDGDVTLSNFEHGDDGDNSIVYTTYNLKDTFDGVENGSVKAVVTAGEDRVGNSANLTAGDNSTTFGIDTVEPKITIDQSGTLPNPLSGLVDVEQHVTVQDADGDTPTIGWENSNGETTEFSNPANVDTRELREGPGFIYVTVSDDNGTTRTAELATDVDNVDPSVSTSLENGQDVSGTLDLTEHFTVENNGSYEAEYSADAGTLSDGQLDLSEVSDETSVTVTVAVDDTEGESVALKQVELNVDQLNDLSVDAEANEHGQFVVDVKSEAKLDTMNVTLSAADEYFQQQTRTLTRDEFEYVGTEDGLHKYTVQVNKADNNADWRDGSYTVSLNSASDGMRNAVLTDVDDASVDRDAWYPEAFDAQIVGMDDDGRTVVQVKFTEPLASGEISEDAFSFEGSTDANVMNVEEHNAKGYVLLTFNTTIQTGDAPEITVHDGAVSEQVDADSGWDDDHPDENPKTSTEIATIELNLDEGFNMVSVPAASGWVSVESLDLSNVEGILAYDKSKYEENWGSYIPGEPDNDFTRLEGGQGYIFMMNSSDRIDVTAFNKPAGMPNEENVEPGWNLLGHYQEGSQSVDKALMTVNDANVMRVLGQTGNGLNLEDVGALEPGEAYWVSVDSADDYMEAPQHSGPVVTDITVTDADATTDDLTNGGEVTVSAQVVDPDGVKYVTADVSSLTGVSEDYVTLTENANGAYTNTVSVSASEGDYDISVFAEDNLGVQSWNYIHTVTVDTTANDASVSASFDSNSDEITVTVSADESVDTSTLAVNLQDDDGDVDTSLTSWSETGTNTYEATYSVSESTDEDYTATLSTATDEAGNSMVASTSQSDTVTVDTTVEATSLTATDAGSQNVQVTVESNEQLSDLTVDLSGAEAGSVTGVGTDFTETDNGDGTYTYTATYEGSSDGDYSVTLTSASDTNDNTDSNTGLSDSVTIDTSPSMTNVAGDTAGNSMTISFSEDVTGVGNADGSPADFIVTIDDGQDTHSDVAYSVQGSPTDTASEWTLELTSYDLSDGDTITIDATSDNDVVDTDGGSEDGLPSDATVTSS